MAANSHSTIYKDKFYSSRVFEKGQNNKFPKLEKECGRSSKGWKIWAKWYYLSGSDWDANNEIKNQITRKDH